MQTCRDCQIEVSRSAKACPACGARKPWKGKGRMGAKPVRERFDPDWVGRVATRRTRLLRLTRTQGPHRTFIRYL